MKCYHIPLLRRKIFLIKANNRDYRFKYCNRRLNTNDRHLREWYLHKNPIDNEIRMLDKNLNNYINVFGKITFFTT